MATIVVKIGGSLYDLPQLGKRLDDWLIGLPAERILIVPGGGLAADAIRCFDETQRLGEESAHWLALRALSLNAHVLQQVIPGSRLVNAEALFGENPPTGPSIVDMVSFAEWDESNPNRLPHTWNVTSDSLALRLAEVTGADTLYLLKSVAIPPDENWQACADRGFVDAFFPVYAERLGKRVAIRVNDFRSRNELAN